MSWSIIEAWASLFIAIMLFSVLRHPTCASCVAWMYCRMSDSIKHVWACPDLSSRCGHRSLFQSCCCWCYVIQPVHHILHECVVGCPILSSMYEHVPIYLLVQLHVSSWTVHLHTFLHSLHSNSYSSSWMISVRDKKHGTCLRNRRGCAAWALISYCNHVVVGATSSNLCIMCCMNVL